MGVLRTGCVLLCLLLAGCSSDARTADSGPTSPSATTSAAPSAGPSRGGPEDLVDTALAELDRRAQVAQLFLVGVPLDDLRIGESLIRDGVGGVFLAGRSAASVQDLAATTAAWRSLAPGPGPWIAADQEGGAVQSLQGPGFDRLPSAVDQGRLPPDRLTALAQGMGTALSGAGVNLDLAPVLDVVPAGTERANAPIGRHQRQYGSTAAIVSTAAGTIVDGLAQGGVTATLKHFP